MLVLMAVFFWPTIPDDNISSMGKIYPPRINKPTGKSVIVPPLEDTKLKGQTEILSVLPVPSSVTKEASADQDVKPTTILPIEEKKLKDQTEEISAAAPPNVTKNGKYAIQIIAYPEARKKDAMVFAKDLRKTQPDVYVERVNIRKRGVWYRILTGHFTSIEDATNYMKEKKILEAHPGSFIQLKSAVRSRLEGDNVYP
jgi:cell division septation protein DedD